MKTNVNLNSCPVILSAAKNLFQFIIIACMTGSLLTACHEDLTTDMVGGEQVDEVAFNVSPSFVLQSLHSAKNVVKVTIPVGRRLSKQIHIISTKAVLDETSYLVSVNSILVDGFNKANNTDYAVLPEGYFSLPNVNCTFFPGMRHSTQSSIMMSSINSSGELLNPGKYVLPIETKNVDGDTSSVLYFLIDIVAPYKGDVPLYNGPDFFIVFYVNTNEYQPMLASDWYNEKYSPSFERIWEGTIGNIVNLRTVTIGYDEVSERALLKLGPDMRYVLDHYEHYILPLQEQGRKVCLSIEGSGCGLGFCNLTDVQIADFSNQLSQIVKQFGLDGVNLWDRNSGYGEGGFPPMNTTSYPKLIKSLKESLGQHRIVTVTDYEAPTAYFSDVESMGGINVGEYIDYAWSGYNSKYEPYQVVDPYHPGHPTVSTLHTRQPIAGLDPQKYGCINVTWYPKVPFGTTWDEIWDSEDNIHQWVSAGLKQNNIFVYDDLMTTMQNEYEGTWAPEIHFMLDDSLSLPFNKQFSYSAYTHIGELPDGSVGYGKWIKDW